MNSFNNFKLTLSDFNKNVFKDDKDIKIIKDFNEPVTLTSRVTSNNQINSFYVNNNNNNKLNKSTNTKLIDNKDSLYKESLKNIKIKTQKILSFYSEIANGKKKQLNQIEKID